MQDDLDAAIQREEVSKKALQTAEAALSASKARAEAALAQAERDIAQAKAEIQRVREEMQVELDRAIQGREEAEGKRREAEERVIEERKTSDNRVTQLEKSVERWKEFEGAARKEAKARREELELSTRHLADAQAACLTSEAMTKQLQEEVRRLKEASAAAAAAGGGGGGGSGNVPGSLPEPAGSSSPTIGASEGMEREGGEGKREEGEGEKKATREGEKSEVSGGNIRSSRDVQTPTGKGGFVFGEREDAMSEGTRGLAKRLRESELRRGQEREKRMRLEEEVVELRRCVEEKEREVQRALLRMMAVVKAEGAAGAGADAVRMEGIDAALRDRVTVLQR